MAFALFTIALFSVVPWVLYLGQGGGLGPRWGVVAAGEVRVGTGAYRQTMETRWKRGSAPLIVRVAALSCFYLGQMVVPGAFAAMAGIAFVCEMPMGSPVWPVVEMSAPTGLCVATFLLAAGWSMLEGDPTAIPRARRAVRWSILHNVSLLVGLGAATAADRHEPELGLVPCIYACVSIAQAFLVWRAAAAIEAYDAARSRLPAPLDVEIAVLAGER